MTRIGYFVPQFPGQTHSFFWREIEAMRAMGADVSLISTRRPARGAMPHGWAAKAAAATRYLSQPTPAWSRDLAALPGALAHLSSLIASQPPRDAARLTALVPFALALKGHAEREDLSHVHLGSAGATATIAALSRRLGGPDYSLTLHNPVRVFGSLQPIKWQSARFGAAITPEILADLRAHHGAYLPKTMLVQPMGVDTDAFRRTAPYEAWRGEGPFRIFCCGRLNRAKGHDQLAQAVGLMRAQGIPAVLTIAGEDDEGGKGYRRVLEAALEARGLTDAVTLLGAVSEDEVRERNLSAHAFALASHAEPLGVAYMEAMSLAVPTVGTAAGGVPHLIEDGEDGLLVPPGDAAALAAALSRVAREPGLASRLSAAGRAKATARFGAEIGARRLLTEIRRERAEHDTAPPEASADKAGIAA